MPQKSALARLQDKSAYSKNAAEKLDWSYYDGFTMATATATNRLFTIPLGQAGKTLAITNFPLAGQLPQGQNFTIFAIKPFYVTVDTLTSAALLNFYSMLFDTTVEFVITGKDSMGTWTLAELFGVSMMTAFTPTVAGDNEPMVMPDFKGIYPLNIPITIGATGTIELRVTHHVAPNATLDGDRVKISLQGKLIRMS